MTTRALIPTGTVSKFIQDCMKPGWEWGSRDCITFAQLLLEDWTGESWEHLRPDWAVPKVLTANNIANLERWEMQRMYLDGLLAAGLKHSDEPHDGRNLFILSPAERTWINGRKTSSTHPPMLGVLIGEGQNGVRSGVIMTREGLQQVAGFTLSHDWFTVNA